VGEPKKVKPSSVEPEKYKPNLSEPEIIKPNLKSKMPNQKELERYNHQKNAQIIADEYLDIDAQIQLIDAREDMDINEKNQMKKNLLDEIDEYIHQLGSNSGNLKNLGSSQADLNDMYKISYNDDDD
jgi:hypothetical protein